MRDVISSRRSWGALAIIVAATGSLSACGGGDGESAGTEVTIQPTSYVTRPPATTAPPTGASVPDQAVAGQVYTVASGDYWSKIASLYQVTVDELMAYNDKDSTYVLQPGDEIKIPANGIPPAAQTDDSDPNTITAGGTSPEPEEDDVVTAGTANTCVQGKHEIQEGDYPGKVAGDYDLTVEQLNEANRSTSGYGAFYVGLEIVIPCTDDEE